MQYFSAKPPKPCLNFKMAAEWAESILFYDLDDDLKLYLFKFHILISKQRVFIAIFPL